MPRVYEPDWYYGVSEKTFKHWLEVDFTGVGWYLFADGSTGLTIKDGEDKYKVLFYNKRDPRALMHQILSLPVYDHNDVKHIGRCWRCVGSGESDDRSWPSGCRTGKKISCYVCDGTGKSDQPQPELSDDDY